MCSGSCWISGARLWTEFTADICRGLTGGRGVFSMEEAHYDKVPTHLQQEIMDAREKEKEEED